MADYYGENWRTDRHQVPNSECPGAFSPWGLTCKVKHTFLRMLPDIPA